MKTNTRMKNTLSVAVAVAGMLFSSLATGRAATGDPSGGTNFIWDCVLSGHRSGLACLIFSNDFTFGGYEMLVPNAPTVDNNPRGPNTDIGRNGSSTSNSVNSAEQIFGSIVIGGLWTFDNKGRVIGFLTEVSSLESCVTNQIAISTNGVGLVASDEFCQTVTGGALVCFTNQLICIALSNGVSFVGTVAQGKRLELNCSTPFGSTVYRGIPAVNLPDQSGFWYGTLTGTVAPGSPFEFFNLSVPTDFHAQFPNTYDVSGVDPTYNFSGHAMFSSQKKMALVVGIDPDDQVVRAVTGSFNARNGAATLKGWQQPAGPLQGHVTFQVNKQIP